METVKAKKRLQQNVISNPAGDQLKVNWMPDNRVRLDFVGCGPAVVTKIFPNPKTGDTHVEIGYGRKANALKGV
jgi:hypothetical protein